MPIHQNQDGTWQWGKSGKKYKKKQDAIKQMKAIFANGYVEKHASYADVLGMIKKAAQDPGDFIQSVARKPRWAFSNAVPSVAQIANPKYRKRYMLWKTLGFDDPKQRQKAFKDAYYKTLYQRESGNRPTMTRKTKRGKIFSAGIGSMDQPALDQAKKNGDIPKDWELKDLAIRANLPTVQKAIQGLQQKFYNKGQQGNIYALGGLKPLSFTNPRDIKAMYLRYNRGRLGAKRHAINDFKVRYNNGQHDLNPYRVSYTNNTNKIGDAFQKDFKKTAPLLHQLAY